MSLNTILKLYKLMTLILPLVPILDVNASEVEYKTVDNTRFKRYHHEPHDWGTFYESQQRPQSSYDDYNSGYHHQHSFDYYQHEQPYSHHSVQNSEVHYNGQLTHPHNSFPDHQYYHYQHPHHNNGPFVQYPYPGQDYSMPNSQNINNPTWQIDGQQNIPNTDGTGNPSTPNENNNSGFRPSLQTPISDRLQGLSPFARGDRLGAFINSSIFGADISQPNILISPTGVLLQDEDDGGGGSSSSSSISCDQPYELPPLPNFREAGRRISDVRCYEYIWQLNERNKKELWDKQCTANNNRGKRSLNSNDRPKRQTGQATFVGGQTAVAEEFPHMAALGWNGVNGDLVFKCGATLISANYLLTAAHCTAVAPDPTLSDLVPRIARIGGINLAYKANGQGFTASRRRRQLRNPDQVDVGIINIIPHEQYDPNKRYFDIALMQLENKLQFNRNLQPACLWTDINSSSRIKKAVGAGWGVTGTGRQSSNLMAGELDIIDVNTCNNLLSASFGNKFNGFADHQLCAGKLAGGVDACQGDSGGPLQVKIQLPVKTQGSMHTILGVISSGVGCAKPNTPGVYTRVTSFVDWIESKIWT